jgi:hypothetical protein
LHLWDILCHGSAKGVVVIPLDFLLKLIREPFDYTCTLSLDEAIEVVSVANSPPDVGYPTNNPTFAF